MEKEENLIVLLSKKNQQNPTTVF